MARGGRVSQRAVLLDWGLGHVHCRSWLARVASAWVWIAGGCQLSVQSGGWHITSKHALLWLFGRQVEARITGGRRPAASAARCSARSRLRSCRTDGAGRPSRL